MSRRSIEVLIEGSAAEAFVEDTLIKLGVETFSFDTDEDTSYTILKELTKAAGPAGFEVVTEPKGNTTIVRVRRQRTTHKFSQERCPVAYHERLKSDPGLFRAETHPGGRREDDEERFEIGHCKRCGSTLELATRKNGPCQVCGKTKYFCSCAKRNPPTGIKDKTIWYRAIDVVKPRWKQYDEPYAVVHATYKRMGGR